MRERERPGKKPLAASVGFHVAVVVVALWARVPPPDLPEFITPAITIVSLPVQQEEPTPAPPPEEELVVETPVPVVAEEPPPVLEERRREEERPEPTPTPPPRPEPEPEPEEPGTPEPSVGTEEINIRMEGLKRDFPEYYGNIITQIRRCLRFSGGGRLETVVLFYIRRDGTVDTDQLRFVQQSGNMNFDYAAMGAVECAGQGRFGPLPEELGLDRIPILFTFTPGGG